MEKEEQHCSHYFEFSHTETRQASYKGTNMESVDVVVCHKCGLVKRN